MGCFFNSDSCVIKDQKNPYGTPMRFYGEQVRDSSVPYKDEIFDLANPFDGGNGATDQPSNGGPDGVRDGWNQGQRDGHYEASDLLSETPSTGKNDRAENCTESPNNGKLAGYGPDCDIEQRGKGALHACVFDNVKDCETKRQTCEAGVSEANFRRVSVNSLHAIMPASRPVGCDETFKNCIESSTRKCVCSDCQWDVCITNCGGDVVPPPGDDDDDDDDGGGGGSDFFEGGVPLSTQRFTDSSYDRPIPVIYGRYISMGNIIWASEPRRTTITETETVVDDKGTRRYTTETFIFHSDFALALCEGVVDGLLRVWFGDTLLFSRALNTDNDGRVLPTDGFVVDEIENTLLFSSGSADVKRYDETKMKITLYPGSEEQTPAPVFGFRSPAYRGICYLLFENVNLSYLGGNIPEIRVEIADIDVSAPTPFMQVDLPASGDLAGSLNTLMWGDTTGDQLFVASGPSPGRSVDGLRRLRYGTLEYVNDIIDEKGVSISGSTFNLLVNGAAIYQVPSEVVVYTPTYDAATSRFPRALNPLHTADAWGELGRASISLNAFVSNNSVLESRAAFMAVTTRGDFRTSSYDESTKAMDYIDFVGLSGLEAFGSKRSEEFYDTSFGVTRMREYVDVFGLVGTSQIRRYRYTVSDTSQFKGALIPVAGPLSQTNFPASVWGGDTDGVSAQFLLHDVAREAVVIFLRKATGRGYIFSLDTNDNVRWSIAVDNFPDMNFQGPKMLRGAASFYLYVNMIGEIVRLDLTSGETTVIGNTAVFAGPQIYDPIRESITRMSGSTINRIFPTRSSFGLLTVADLIRRIAVRSGIPVDFIDVSDVEDITTVGVGLFGNTRPRNVIQSLVDMFGLTTWEQDGKIHFSRTDFGDTHFIHESDLGVEYERTTPDEYQEGIRFTFSYADIENFVRPYYQMISQAITADTSVEALSHIKYDTPIALTTETGSTVAEQMYALMHTSRENIRFSIPAKRMQYVPNDRLTIDFDDTFQHTYLIEEVLFNSHLDKAEIFASRDVSYLVSEAVSLEPYDDPRRNKVQKGFDKTDQYKIRTFWTTPYTLPDMLATKTHYVVYTGVEAESPMNPVTVKNRVLNGLEDVHSNGPSLSDPLHLGVLVNLPSPTASCFSTDRESSMTIRFNRPETVALFQVRPHFDLVNDRTLNTLLVGKEWIQFADFSVDPDGRTVTFDVLLRGRNGTEGFISQHVAGQECVYPTARSFRPTYIGSGRFLDKNSVSFRLTSPKNIQNTSAPVITASSSDSIRPWAPSDIDAFRSGTDPNELYYRFQFRSKWEDDLDDQPAFAPDADTFAKYNTGEPIYSPKYVLMATRTAGLPLVEVERFFIRQFEDKGFNSPLFTKESNQPLVLLTAQDQLFINGFGDPETIHVYVAQIGGPKNNRVGFIGYRAFEPGIEYDTLPPQPGAVAFSLKAYVVLNSEGAKLRDAEYLMVLKP